MKSFLSATIVACLTCALTTPATAQELADFNFFTMSPRDVDGIATPFEHCDIAGLCHSNDSMFFCGSPTFHGPVTIATGEFIYLDNAHPHFDQQPETGVPTINLPARDYSLVAGAKNYSDHHGTMMTWIKLMGQNGINIYQYPLGGAPHDSVIDHLAPPLIGAIFVNGDCEVEGLLSGKLAIGCTGNMYLVDDVRYSDSNSRNGEFDEQSERGLLNLVSEGSIIIKDNVRNGKANCSGEFPNIGDYSRANIVIDAAVVALGGSFTFEHQNYDGDVYQGPTPDERGVIFVKGSIIERYQGRLHTDNHGIGENTGTGYFLELQYDQRFETGNGWFPNAIGVPLEGNFHSLELRASSYLIGMLYTDSLTVGPGVRLDFNANGFLNVSSFLQVEGTLDKPVNFRQNYRDSYLHLRGGEHKQSFLSHCNFAQGISVELWADTCALSNVTFVDKPLLHGSASIDSCTFNSGVTVKDGSNLSLTRSLLLDGATLYGQWDEALIRNNTIVNGGTGIWMMRGGGVRAVNNMFYHNQRGILCEGWGAPVLEYNCLYQNGGDYVGCAAGVGSLSANPEMEAPWDDQYTLRRTSPCIDAGDPHSPRDPDGTRADMGAFYYAHRMEAGEEFGIWNLEFRMKTAPNPFNERTMVTVQVPAAVKMRLAVYDVSGRLRGTLFDGQMEKGSRSFALDASGWPAGIYLVRMQAGEKASIAKIVKIN